MPIFDYRCPECGKVEEHMHLGQLDDAPYCSACERLMDRLIGLPSVKFKGGGWTPKRCNDLDPDKHTKQYYDPKA